MCLNNSLHRFFSLSRRVGEGWGEGCCGYANIVRPLTLSLSRTGRGNLCPFFAVTVFPGKSRVEGGRGGLL